MDYLLVAERKVVGSIEAKAEGAHAASGRERRPTATTTASRSSSRRKRNLPRYADRAPLPVHLDRHRDAVHEPARPHPPAARGLPLPPPGDARRLGAQEPMPYRARLRQLPPLNADGPARHPGGGHQEPGALARRRPPEGAGGHHDGRRQDPASRSPRPTGCCASAGPSASSSSSTASRSATRRETEFLSFVSPRRRPALRRPVRRAGAALEQRRQVRERRHLHHPAPVLDAARQADERVRRGARRGLHASSSATTAEPVEVAYNAKLPVEFFDLIFIDECHRSIYGRWGQVLDYFDAFVVGLTATPTPTTLAYFDDNVIAEYTQEQIVFDGVNVDQQLYRIRTEVGEQRRDHRSRRVGQGPRQAHARASTSSSSTTSSSTSPRSSTARSSTPARSARSSARSRSGSRPRSSPDRDEVPKTIFFCQARPARRGHPQGHLRGVRPRHRVRQENHLQGRGHRRAERQRRSATTRSCASPSPSSRLAPAPTSRPSSAWSSCAWSARACCSTRCAAARSAP